MAAAVTPCGEFTSDRLATPLGDVLVVCSADALCVLHFVDDEAATRAMLRRRFGSLELVPTLDPLGITTGLERYFAGDLTALDGMRVRAQGTPFQQRVWAELRTIAAGRTRTYGEIAARLGATHARAVGQANALNPIAIVVPCHRVIGADSTLTGYAGGLHRKRWLLDHELEGGALRLPL